MLNAAVLKNALLVAAVVAAFLAAGTAAAAAEPARAAAFEDDSFSIALPDGFRFESPQGAFLLRVRDVGNGDPIHILLTSAKRADAVERCAKGESIGLVEADGSSTDDVEVCILGTAGAPYVEMWTPDFRLTGNAIDKADAYRLVGVLDQLRKAVRVHKPADTVASR